MVCVPVNVTPDKVPVMVPSNDCTMYDGSMLRVHVTALPLTWQSCTVP
ncbi:hypothetical protein BZL30_2702 [Mycobacterium kansasii]|uniref:Uncharacterized protein n=1 Tax=Mycobacterium kansasii TaxID=1768 RepID=A0A1V3XG31_MYCKA|nr:hypothetical protein BZL30_2702 [Mycobacterium kansasii]